MIIIYQKQQKTATILNTHISLVVWHIALRVSRRMMSWKIIGVNPVGILRTQCLVLSLLLFASLKINHVAEKSLLICSRK